MRKKWFVGTALFFLLFATACSSNTGGNDANSPSNAPANTGNAVSEGEGAAPAAGEAADPYGPEKELVTLNIAQVLPPGDAGLPAGQTVDN
ncbi:hypothetical protein K0U00_45505, partial [Paenibacillus sepulcri]|nr:hypothetical protein [Paenibacillus sepulcri]